jgi:hypothetical protein
VVYSFPADKLRCGGGFTAPEVYKPSVEPVRGGAAGLEDVDSYDSRYVCLIVYRGVQDALDPEACPAVVMTGRG